MVSYQIQNVTPRKEKLQDLALSQEGKLQSRPGDLKDRALKLILVFPHVLDSVGLRWPEASCQEGGLARPILGTAGVRGHMGGRAPIEQSQG